MIPRARCAVLWSLGTFVLLQFGLAVAIESWLPEFRDPFYSRKEARLRRRVVNHPEQPLTVVMLGSSRTSYALQGSRLERNLANELRGACMVLVCPVGQVEARAVHPCLDQPRNHVRAPRRGTDRRDDLRPADVTCHRRQE